MEVPIGVSRGGLCGDPKVRFMLIIMIIMWVCSSMNFMVISAYLKYVPGGEFINVTAAACAEMSANLTAGIIF